MFVSPDPGFVVSRSNPRPSSETVNEREAVVRVEPDHDRRGL
jgi:hypothetical protein